MGNDFSVEEAALKEYEVLHNSVQQIYQQYANSLLLIVIGSGAVGAVIITTGRFALLGVLAILLTLLINTWVAGWAYLHLELWSHRVYFEGCERFLRSRFNLKGQDAPFTLYQSKLNGMYQAAFFNGKVRCHHVLDLCFVGSSLVIYVISFLAGLFVGFPSIGRWQLLPVGLRHCIEVVGPWMFSIVSFGCLGCSLAAWVVTSNKVAAGLRDTCPMHNSTKIG